MAGSAMAVPAAPTITCDVNCGAFVNAAPSFTITGDVAGNQIDWTLDAPLGASPVLGTGPSPLSTGPLGNGLGGPVDGAYLLHATQTDLTGTSPEDTR